MLAYAVSMVKGKGPIFPTNVLYVGKVRDMIVVTGALLGKPDDSFVGMGQVYDWIVKNDAIASYVPVDIVSSKKPNSCIVTEIPKILLGDTSNIVYAVFPKRGPMSLFRK